MDLIAQFVARYRKEYDFYEQACRICAQMLDAKLQTSGIRSIVTSRAKNPTRLEAKIRQRHAAKRYSSIDEIFEDIVDLAGVRVALYFPAEREEVGKIIATQFNALGEPKSFPGPPPADSNKAKKAPSYKKRFSGYLATHYRVRLREDLVNESQKRYIEATIEIQVASVLMHAWSEVEHDLVYKPLAGLLSEEEHAILDELNGLVLAGEIALERLQKAGERRVSEQGRDFLSHYDLASALLDLSRGKFAGLDVQPEAVGRVDILFQLLKELNLNKPDKVAQYISTLHADLERRPLAEQIIDQILAEEPGRYKNLERVLYNAHLESPYDQNSRSRSEALERYLATWVKLEQRAQIYVQYTELASQQKQKQSLWRNSKIFPAEIGNRIADEQMFRNSLVHGEASYSTPLINDHTSRVERLIAEVDQLIAQAKARARHEANSTSTVARKPGPDRV